MLMKNFKKRRYLGGNLINTNQLFFRVRRITSNFVEKLQPAVFIFTLNLSLSTDTYSDKRILSYITAILKSGYATVFNNNRDNHYLII